MKPEMADTRLRDAHLWSRSRLRSARETRIRLLRQLGGAHYGDDTSDRVPMNLIELARTIYLNLLMSSPPAAMVSTKIPQLKPRAYDFESVLNMCIEKSDMYGAIRGSIDDALFGMGILRLGLVKDGEIDDGAGGSVPYGKPAIYRVDLDDWVHDMSASRWETVGYMGHRYTVDLESARENRAFDKKLREKLSVPDDPTANEEGDERAVNLQTGGEQNETYQYRDRCELWDLYFPEEQKVKTYAADKSGIGEKPLLVVDWKGPHLGPYHRLIYGEMQGNTLPLPPSYVWLDIHELVNILFNKMGDQAERQRTIFGYKGGTGSTDARELRDSQDGEWRKLLDPNSTTTFQVPGVDPNTLAFTIQCQNIYSWLAGNLDALGGLSPQTETVGQDRLISQAASKRIQAMNERTLDFVTRLMREYGEYVWNDPLQVYETERSVPGFKSSIPVELGPEDRIEKFPDYDIRIDPISMHRMTPSEEVQSMMMVWERILLPAMPILEAQGISLNMEGFLRHLSRRGNWHWLDDMLTFTGVPGPSTPQAKGSSTKPTQTTRRYERVNRAGATRENSNTAMVQRLLGGKQQPSEAQAAFRRTT